MGSRLSLFLPAWHWITSAVAVAAYALWKEVVALLTGGGGWGGVQLSQDQGNFHSHHFLASKRTGGFHPIPHLSGLNTYLRVSKFHMETLNSFIQDVHRGWWIVSLDLKDTF